MSKKTSRAQQLHEVTYAIRSRDEVLRMIRIVQQVTGAGLGFTLMLPTYIEGKDILITLNATAYVRVTILADAPHGEQLMAALAEGRFEVRKEPFLILGNRMGHTTFATNDIGRVVELLDNFSESLDEERTPAV